VNEADPLLVGLAGGAIGAVLAALFVQIGRAWIAWGEVTLHDEEAAERNAQLLVWVDDRTRALVPAMQAITEDHNRRGVFYSGFHGAALADAKAQALHQYRDEEWNARLDLARIGAREGGWHAFWRYCRRSKSPRLTEDTYGNVEPFLARWRETVTRHGDEAVPLDRTRRTTEDALAELPTLNLT
jgi:hypothetical protein